MSSTIIDIAVGLLGACDIHGGMVTGFVDDVALHHTPVLRCFPWTRHCDAFGPRLLPPASWQPGH